MSLLLSKKQLLTEFDEMVMKEKECLQNQEWKKVDNIIRSKQLKLVKIDRINEKLKKIVETDSHEEKEIQAEIIEIIKSIKKIEDENIEMIKENIKESKKDFKDIKVKQKVNTAYLRVENIQKDGCFVDKFK